MHNKIPRPAAEDLRQICEVFASIGDTATMKAFLEEMLTPAERSNLALRWKLLGLLHRKVPQRKIAEDLHLSLCKITRGSKVLKKNNSVALRLLDRHPKTIRQPADSSPHTNLFC